MFDSVVELPTVDACSACNSAFISICLPIIMKPRVSRTVNQVSRPGPVKSLPVRSKHERFKRTLFIRTKE